MTSPVPSTEFDLRRDDAGVFGRRLDGRSCPTNVAGVRFAARRCMPSLPCVEIGAAVIVMSRAMLDYDGDGWLELYFATTRNLQLSAGT